MNNDLNEIKALQLHLKNRIDELEMKVKFLEPYKERYEAMKEEIEVAKRVIAETQVRATKWYELYRQAIEKNDSPL